MHGALIARKVSLGALVALALLAVALFVATPGASADRSQCSSNTICAWSNSGYIGNFSFWNASDRGCHNHESNPRLRSVWNRTSNTISIPGKGLNIGPGGSISLEGGANEITGVICT